ncbi:MAG: class II glutamine amidotransferase [Oscillospiraceae bacterium]|nr:class II glutamine amidotransferase [Oscillospiraceae bacterium]
MCALLGICDYSNCFTSRNKNIILSVLSAESQIRGTDATGIAYVKNNRLQIYKKPIPAHKMRYNLPPNVKTVMGHTRMTTQGSEKHNYNNHPFFGRVKNNTFALAHNGILHGDSELRKTLNLPKTKIETDSYIAVQIIEKENSVTFDSLRKMAETVWGSFTFTVLDKYDNLYFVRGDNPLCIYHFADRGFYLYASTEEILQKSLKRLGIEKYYNHKVQIDSGDILRIASNGDINKSKFQYIDYYPKRYSYYNSQYTFDYDLPVIDEQYLSMLKQIARYYGYTDRDIDELVMEGWRLDEIELMLYDDFYESDNEIEYCLKRV